MAAGREGREALFDAAVSAVLRGWPALKMAVSNQFGGPQSQAKATWMESATAQWMRENVEIQADELETFLETLLYQEFDTIVDDGSTPEVSRKICDLYRSCCSGNEASVRTFLSSQPLPPPLPLVSSNHLPSSDDTMEEEAEGSGSGEVLMEEERGEKEEEGEWEVVQKSRRRSKN
jgi:hypothetical protein